MNAIKRVYLDTSALLPYYREEAVSLRINDLLISLTPPLLISDLTRVEFVSALSQWVRMREITDAQAGLVENQFLKDIRSGLLVAHPLTTGHFRQAEKWISARKTSLRTLDGLHLAFSLGMDAELITCDKTLQKSAEQFGVTSRYITSARQ